METFATIVYVISDEVLRMLKIPDDPRSQMSNAEVITFSIFTAKYFQSNHKFSRLLCKKLKLFPNILSNSRLNRRIHKIPWGCWTAIFRFLAVIFKRENNTNEYAVDSFPIPFCQKNRIDKRKVFLERKYLGYAASKKQYFCGIKVHMVVTKTGQPVEVCFKPGSESDLKVFWSMELDIPLGSKIYADGAYNCFELEDILSEDSVTLLAKRGSRAKNRVRSRAIEKEISSKRQIIETAFSCITDYFPRNLRSCTERGFLIKIFSSILAFSLSFIHKSLLS